MGKVDIGRIKQHLEDIFILIYNKEAIESMIKQSQNRIKEHEKMKGNDLRESTRRLEKEEDQCLHENIEMYYKKKSRLKYISIALFILFIILAFLIDSLFCLKLAPCMIVVYIVLKVNLYKKDRRASSSIFDYYRKEKEKMLSEIEDKYLYINDYRDKLANEEKALKNIKETLTITRQKFAEEFPMFKPYLSLECMVYLYNFIEQEGEDTNLRICLEELGQVVILSHLSREVDKREEEIDDVEAEFYAELANISEEFNLMSKQLYESYEDKISEISERTERKENLHCLQVFELCDIIRKR